MLKGHIQVFNCRINNFKILGIAGDVRLDYYLASAYSDRLKFEAWGELCNFMMKKYQEDEESEGSCSQVNILPGPQ
jgi:hypothetical protein